MNTVSYVNTANITTDITVEASVDDTVTIMGAENGEITGTPSNGLSKTLHRYIADM